MPHRRGHRQRPRPIRQESSDSTLPVYIKLKNTRNSKSENETLLKNKFNLHRVSNVNNKGLLPRVDRWYRSSVVNNFDIETILNDPDVEAVFIDESITENDGTFEPSLIYSTTNYHYTLNDETGWDSAMVEYGTGDYSPLLLATGTSAYPFDTDYKDKLILFDPPVHSPIQWINGTPPENYGECWWRNPCLENCPDGGSSYYECLYNDWAQCGDENEKHNMFQCTNWDWGHGHMSYHETAVLSVLGANSDTHGSCPNCKLGMVYDKVKDSFFQEPNSEFFIQRAGQSTYRENRLQTFERAVENAIEYGAVAINCSWGNYSSTPPNQAGNYQARREYWQALVDDAWDNNTLIFASAGNNEKIGNNDFMCNPNHVWELGDGTTMTANECSQITDEQECLDKSYDSSNEIAYGPCRWRSSGYCTFSDVVNGHRFPTCLEKVIQVQGSSGGKSNWGTEEILTDELGIYAISAPMYQFTSTERNDVGLFMTSGNGYDQRAMLVNHPYSNAIGGPTFGLYWTESTFTSTGEYTIDYTSDGNDQYDNYRLYEEYQNDGTYQTLIEDHFWFLNEEHDDYPAPLVINKWGISSATSYNTPMVAGVAGLLKSHNPDLTSAQMIEIIFETRNSIDDIPLCDGVENYSWPYQPSPGGGSSCTTTRIPEINVKAAMDYLYENYPPPLTPVNPIPESWNYVVPNMLENVGYTGNDWYTPPETVEGAGCTDPFAINYDPMAVEDDGSCYIPPEYVEGFPIIKYDGFWLIDEVQMMGSVCELLLPGTICSGVSAWIDMDDYPDDEIPINFGGTGAYFYQEWCNQSYLEINPNQATRDYFWVHCEPDENQNQIPDNIDEEISTYQQQYDGLFPFLVFQDYHLYDGNTEMQYYCPAGTVATVMHFSDYIDDYPNGGLTSSYNLDDLTLHNDYGQSMNYYWLACEVSDIPGCTDSSACNYNSEATTDDGSCDYGSFQCWNGDLVCDESECNNIPGDANFSGHLSVADVVIILQQIIQSSDIGLTPEEIYQQYPEMDFSGNGRVAVEDIVQMVQYMLYGSEVTVSSAESQQLQEIQRQLDRLGDVRTTPTQQSEKQILIDKILRKQRNG